LWIESERSQQMKAGNKFGEVWGGRHGQEKAAKSRIGVVDGCSSSVEVEGRRKWMTTPKLLLEGDMTKSNKEKMTTVLSRGWRSGWCRQRLLAQLKRPARSCCWGEVGLVLRDRRGTGHREWVRGDPSDGGRVWSRRSRWRQIWSLCV